MMGIFGIRNLMKEGSQHLAAVGTGGSGGPASMRPGAGAGGLGSGEHSSGTGLTGDLGDLGGLEADLSKTSLDEIRLWGSSFDRLMRHPAGCKLFKEFLVSEYSDENIAFWLACEQLKRESNPEKVEEKAKVIYEDYISIISPKEMEEVMDQSVNLSDESLKLELKRPQ
ncbi:hypothetical protein QAD02_001732 [Eretmocerus hayati]|uniref:Uncharacterized protein n=1 Tax=Eretmocerus hayati TaxID=131215 RepID=A0ACC2NI36_9HYME|nr:hypothetical protein QAD02_001732 [Eretmocerus hayati]